MGANMYYYFPEGVTTEHIKTFLGRTLGSGMKQDGEKLVCNDNLISFITSSLDEEVERSRKLYMSNESVNERVNERRRKEFEKNVDLKKFLEKNENAINKILDEKKVWGLSSTGMLDYKSLYLLDGQNSYLGTCSLYFTNSLEDKIKPKDNIIGYLYLDMNFKWMFLSDKLVDFFGGKVIWYDGKDYDEEGNYKLVEKSDALCPLYIGDDVGNQKRFNEALMNIKGYSEDDLIKFADKMGCKFNNNDPLMKIIHYQNNFIAEEMKNDMKSLSSNKKSKLNKF